MTAMQGTRASRRIAIAGLLGLVAGAGAGLAVPWQAAVLIGWDVAAAVFVAWILASVVTSDAATTARLATSEDSTRAGADIMLLAASAASLGAVALTLLKASHAAGGAKAALAGLSLLSIVVSWATVHLVFTLKYARLYYASGEGIDFHDGSKEHSFGDFAYVAFTIGMTYQVSDTDLTARPVRLTALRHALLSFVFGTAIIATTINLIAGLAH
ncbi:MAG TPA: DUF1345 domain-containing protein [Actinomycetota bacterium]|nr:DUF1345 domain-containing protein [Actinomycetota bacterium]